MGQVSIPSQWGATAVKLARLRGWDAAEILSSAHVSPRLLAGDTVSISRAQIHTLTHRIISGSEDESFGLSSIPVPRGTTRLLLFGLASSRNANAAASRWAAFSNAIPSGPGFAIERTGNVATVAIETPMLRLPSVTVSEWMLAVILRTWSWSIMRPVRALRVQFPHARPAGYPDFHHLFHVPIEFDCDGTTFTVDADLLDAPILRSEAEITSLADHPEQLLSTTDDYEHLLPDRVRRIIKAGFGAHMPSVDEISKALGMTPAGLQRTLRRDFGTSVREIRETALRNEAMRCLASGPMPVTELTARLGFSEVSAFTRAFRRWTGSSPAQYRNSVRIGSTDLTNSVIETGDGLT